MSRLLGSVAPALLDVSYRKAGVEDFPGILSLIRTSFDGVLREHGFFDSSPFASSKLPAIPQQGFPWFEMGLKEDSEGFWVAEVEGKLAGLTLSWVRGSLWYLAHLFVSPEHQGLNIGQNLMERAMKHHKGQAITNRALATFAYNPVSISLYARYGIYPREPLYWMEGPSQNVKTDASTKLRNERVVDFEKARSILTRIDELTLGYPREKNHEFLFRTPSARCYLFSTGNEPVGYAYVWQSGRVGPLATASHEIFRDALRSAFRLAATEGAPNVGIAATGSNEQLMQVALEQRMRILDNYLFMSSKPFPNFSNYVLYPTGAMLQRQKDEVARRTLDDLLNNLIGRWSLTGKMGDTALYQEVNAKWILRELFVEMRFSPLRVGEGGNPDYEAVYLIGYDKKIGEYVLHLFDTFGVTSKPVPGIGTRKDNTVRFKFDYTVGPWFNTFTWDPGPRSWKNMITYERKDGSEGTFAEKELTPIR